MGAEVCLACSLKKPIVSLSGPVTIYIEALGLLSDPKLRAISKFHPIKHKTSAEVLGGGVFLAQKKIKEFSSYLFELYKSSSPINE